MRLAGFCDALRRELPIAELSTARLPTKNTFIHFGEDENQVTTQGRNKLVESAPPKLLDKSFHSKVPAHEVKHIRGECRPCAYNFKAYPTHRSVSSSLGSLVFHRLASRFFGT